MTAKKREHSLNTCCSFKAYKLPWRFMVSLPELPSFPILPSCTYQVPTIARRAMPIFQLQCSSPSLGARGQRITGCIWTPGITSRNARILLLSITANWIYNDLSKYATFYKTFFHLFQNSPGVHDASTFFFYSGKFSSYWAKLKFHFFPCGCFLAW